MLAFTTYDPATGQISRTFVGGTPDEAAANMPAGHKMVAGSYSAFTTWFPDGVATEKAAIEPAVAGATISGLPEPCTVSINGGRGIAVSGGSFTATGAPGRYMVTITAPAFKVARVIVEVA